ncbi:MAG: AfsA-related hotdog domain-containing protein [Acidimicrobiales bacterium]
MADESEAGVIVVAEPFTELATLSGVVSVACLAPGETSDRPLVVGQGLSDDERAALGAADPPRAGRRESHKHHPSNTMISLARRTPDDEFEADLLIDGRNHLLADHLTGVHLPGMTLIEAGRQLFLAVTEQYFLERDTSYFFMLSGLTAQFHRFTFPIDVRLKYQVLEQATDGNRSLTFHVRVQVIQAATKTATLEYTFTATEAEKVFRQERRLASRIVERRLAR